MAGWYGAQTLRGSTKAVIAVTLLALLLVAAVPVALLTGLILMLFGHVIGGLALFGGSILVAVAGVTVAGWSGMRHLRRLVAERTYRVVPLDRGDYSYNDWTS